MHHHGRASTTSSTTTSAENINPRPFNRPRRKTDSAVATDNSLHDQFHRQSDLHRRSIAWATDSNTTSTYYSPLTLNHTNNPPPQTHPALEDFPSRLLRRTGSTSSSSGRNSPLRPSKVSFSAAADRPHSRDTTRLAKQQSQPTLSSPLSSSSTSTTTTTVTADIIEPSSSSVPATAFTSTSLPHLRVPQIRFDFECQVPLRKKALISHATSASELSSSLGRRSLNSLVSQQQQRQQPQRDDDFLFDAARRSVSSLHSSNVSNASSQPSSPSSASKKHRNSLPVVPGVRLNDASWPNAPKRRKPSTDIRNNMPSPVSHDDANAPSSGYDRPVNGVDGRVLEETGRESTTDDGGFKSADIFLNIAKDSSRRNSVPRSELRRVSDCLYRGSRPLVQSFLSNYYYYYYYGNNCYSKLPQSTADDKFRNYSPDLVFHVVASSLLLPMSYVLIINNKSPPCIILRMAPNTAPLPSHPRLRRIHWMNRVVLGILAPAPDPPSVYHEAG